MVFYDPSALDALKAKLSDLNYPTLHQYPQKAAGGLIPASTADAGWWLSLSQEEAEAVALSVVSKAKYVHVSINKDWDPKDHPRNPNTGEFVKTLGGYIFGKAKTATFTAKDSKLKNIQFDMHPGDVVFRTPAKNIVVSHSDGSYTIHNAATGHSTNVPEGSTDHLVSAVMAGKFEKVTENPGVNIKATDLEQAADKLAHPDQYGNTAAAKQPTGTLPVPPQLKDGKTKFTAKQYAEYQEKAKGAFLASGSDGAPITSGSWVEGMDGKPYLVHASPHGPGKITAYRWVSTKMQASNLEKEDFFTVNTLAGAKSIPDPTGKPYGVDTSGGVGGSLKYGTLMNAVANATIPNTAVAHKKHVADAQGKELLGPDDKPLTAGKSNLILKSGDWVEIDGKPVQVHSSPNEGNIAIAKWVSTKQQASGNTYDFPASVLQEATKIPDPTGKPYVSSKENQASAVPGPVDYALPNGNIVEVPPGAKVYKHPNVAQTYLIVNEDGNGQISYPFGTTKPLSPDNKAALGQFAALFESEPIFTAKGGKAEAVEKYTAEFLDKHKEGTLKESDLEVIAKSGSDELAEAAAKALSQIVPKAPPKPSWVMAFDKGHPVFIPNVDEALTYLPDLPKGTLVEFGPSDSIYSVPGVYRKVSEVGEDDWESFPSGISVSASNLAVKSFENGFYMQAIPAKSPKATLLSEADYLKPVSEVEVYINTTYHKKGDTWYFGQTTTPASEAAVSGIEKHQKDRAALIKKIGDLAPGNAFLYQTPSGVVSPTYTKGENNTLIDDVKGEFPADKWVPAVTAKFNEGAVFTFSSPHQTTDADASSSNTFVHPVSGEVFQLQSGDVVHKHKTTANAYIIERPGIDKPIFFFNQNGKLYKPKESQKNLHTSYAPVDTWPGKQDFGTTTGIKISSDGISTNNFKINADGLTVTNGDKAPWGGLPAEPTPEPEAKAAPAKPKKSKKQALPTSLTLPDGKVVELSPGSWAGTLPTGEYVLYTPPTAKYQDKYELWDVSGGSYSDFNIQHQAPTKLKKQVTLLASLPLAKPQSLDFSKYTPTKSWPETYDKSEFSATILSIFSETGLDDLVITSNGSAVSWGQYAQFADAAGNPTTWGNLGLDDKLSLLADFKDPSGQLHSEVSALLAEKGADYFPETTSWYQTHTKLLMSKYRSGSELVHRIAALAEEYNNPDSLWTDDQFAQELANIIPKTGKSAATIFGKGSRLRSKFPLNTAGEVLLLAEKQRKFKKTLAGLDFDPYSATTEEYDTYAKSKGFDYLSALDSEHQKTWVLLDLGDPAISPSLKVAVQKASQQAKAKAQVAALASALTVHKDPAPKAVPMGILTKASLSSSYTVGDVHITNIGFDQWSFDAPQPLNLPEIGTDAFVSEYVNAALDNGEVSVSSSNTPAYGGDLDIEAGILKFKDKYSDIYSVDAISAEGGTIVDPHASPQSMLRWWNFHVAGDQIAKYQIEIGWAAGLGMGHPLKDTHPGSPHSPQGKLAYTALANVLSTSEWGQKHLASPLVPSNYSAPDPTLIQALYGPNADKNPILSTWWNTFHPKSVLIKHAPGAPSASSPSPVAVKPYDVSEQSWDLVTESTPDTDFSTLFPDNAGVGSMSVEQLDSAIITSPLAKSQGLISPLLGAVPVHLKRLAVWASLDQNAAVSDVLTAIAAKAKSGEFLEATTPVWISPKGDSYPISPGSSVFKSPGNEAYAILDPQGTNGYLVNESAGSITQLNNTSLSVVKNQYTPVFTMPGEVSWEQAKKDNPDFHKAYWDEALKVENGTSDLSHGGEGGIALTAQLKKNHVLESEYPNLYAQHKTLPDNIRQAVLTSLQNGMGSPMLAVMEYKASKGHYASLQSKGLFSASQPWLPFLSKGQTSEDDYLNFWSLEAKQAYAAHFGVSMDAVPAHLKSLINPETVAVSKVLPPLDQLSLTWLKSKSKGMHSGEIWVDQDGNEWMSKAFPSDKLSKARVDAETIANHISSLYGFGAPVAYTADVHKLSGGDGNATHHKYAYLQNFKEAKYDFTSVGLSDLSADQLGQAMAEHVVDWIVSNHDTHAANLMMGYDGKVFGIDKGQAFKFFPNDKLAEGYLPPGNGAAVWYDKFYSSLRTGSISKETADHVTKHVLRAAQQISKDKDEEYRELLKEAFQNRNFWPTEYPTKESFIDALVERKHNTFEDFIDLYKGLYSKSPYEWDIDTENLTPPRLDDHTWLSVNQDFAGAVKHSGSFGKAIFFASPDLEDSHILMTTTTDTDGKLALTGEAKIRKDGDKALSNWLSQQTVVAKVNQAPQSVPSVSQKDDPSWMPMGAIWFNALVNGSKTVSHHNAEGDQAYNPNTLQQLSAHVEGIQNAKFALDEWKSKNPDKPFEGYVPGPNAPGDIKLQTLEQQDAWESMINTYIGYNDQIEAAKGTTNKISPHFTQPVYQPSKKALDELKAKLKADSSEPEDEVTHEVKVGSKVLKVTYRKASSQDGHLDYDSGVVKLNTNETNLFNTGNMYEIDFGNTVVTYRPWGPDHGVALAQQGLLRFHKKDWKGDPEPITEIFDVLRHMGLSLDPATEESMELYYWTHLTSIMENRKGGATGKWAKVSAHIKNNLTPNMSLAQKLAVYQTAWSDAIGNEKVANADWKPKFSQLNAKAASSEKGFTSGRPYWHRPDYNLEDVKALIGDQFPASTLNNHTDALSLAMSAGLSTEERARLFGGKAHQGQSSGTDQSNGSSAVVYMRQNIGFSNSNYQVVYHPRVLLRTHNYAYNYDGWGKLSAQSSDSPWDPTQHLSFKGGEVMVKNAVSVLDDILLIRFYDANQRKKALDFYKKLGITEINGFPIDQVFVSSGSGGGSAFAQKVWDSALKEEGTP